MNHLGKNNWQLGLNGLILLALLVGVIGSPAPTMAGFMVDGNTTRPAAPAARAKDVATDTLVSVTWSQQIPPETDFDATGPDGMVSGTSGYNVVSNTSIFTPDMPLVAKATYTVTAAGQTDAGGDSQQVPAQFNFDTMVPTSVELVTLEEKPTVTDSWWWVSWPWLMVLMTAVSLVGLVWIKRRRRQAVAH
jgi:hypothetical protein